MKVINSVLYNQYEKDYFKTDFVCPILLTNVVTDNVLIQMKCFRCDETFLHLATKYD